MSSRIGAAGAGVCLRARHALVVRALHHGPDLGAEVLHALHQIADERAPRRLVRRKLRPSRRRETADHVDDARCHLRQIGCPHVGFRPTLRMPAIDVVAQPRHIV